MISHVTACPTNFGENRRNFNVAIGEGIIKSEQKEKAKAGFAVLYFQEETSISTFSRLFF